jgi:methyl-accepting chemotaxis protein/hemerythrin
MRWNDSLSVEIISIDNQHKKLIDLINTLFSEMNSAKNKQAVSTALTKLIEYTGTHFKFEEDLFDKHGYPDTDAHKKIHAELVAKVIDFQKQVEDGTADVSLELMEFLKDWLIKHIKGTDQKYSQFLLSKGVS